MKKKTVSHKNFLIKNYYKKASSKNYFDKILNEIIKNCNLKKDTYHVLSNKFNFNFNINDLNKFRKFKNIAIVGMGGSILGANAIHDFLKYKIKKKVIFFDNLDKDKINKFKKENNKKNYLFIIISKSGNTIETISNLFELNILKFNAKNVLIITERKKNFLSMLSKKYNLPIIEHKYFLGGRYSVLSEVGIIPAYLMGVNIKKLRSNLRRYFKNEKFFLKKSCIALSEIINEKKFKSLIFINYSPKLEKFLFWCQQLIAESLGKKNKGLLPIVSNAPKDHHSLLQLYLHGPKDKIFCIFNEKENKINNKLKLKNISDKFDFLHNKNIEQVKIAQKNALKKTLLKNKIPFREFSIGSSDEQTLGELFSYFILETSIVGKLCKINPFDQPAVDQVKVLTRKLLR